MNTGSLVLIVLLDDVVEVDDEEDEEDVEELLEEDKLVKLDVVGGVEELLLLDEVDLDEKIEEVVKKIVVVVDVKDRVEVVDGE